MFLYICSQIREIPKICAALVCTDIVMSSLNLTKYISSCNYKIDIKT
jgi:hypothetical protein